VCPRPRGAAALVAVPRRPSGSLFPNPVRLVVSSILQTWSECEQSALRDRCRRRRGPNVRGNPCGLSEVTVATWNISQSARE
jgi:hypothetical protein